MSFKNVASIAVLVVAVAFAIQLVGLNGATAQQTGNQSASGFEFARLQVEADDTVTWLVGGNLPVRTESLRAAFQRMGGRGKSTFANMLDQIGSEGWSLVQKDGSVWIFTRRAS